MLPDVSFIEARALEAEPGQPIRLSRAEAEHLLSDPAYHPSLGHPARARHFRRSLPGGGGLHLVLEDGQGELHRDLHDPHAGLDAVARHLVSESPDHFLSLVVAGGILMHRLGRRPG